MAVKLSRVAAVVIGRNEANSLRQSLVSVEAAGLRCLYVDSGSTDGSPAIARELGFPVLELANNRPFSAARGRNEGLDLAIEHWPDVEFVLYLDGDCVLDSAFPTLAREQFDRDDRCAIVTGHLSERHPEASVYNRLCSIEWRSPAGQIQNMNGLGGIMMARISALKSVGGFNEDAIAGEEPDLGVRLRLAGFTLVKIDHPMATHDAAMSTFGQWWRRAVRGGHAIAHRYARHGRTSLRDGRRELMSDLFWGLTVPVVALACLWLSRGLSLLILGGYGLLFWRVRRHGLRMGLTGADAWLMAKFIVISKFAHVVGIAKYVIARTRGEYRVIDWR